MKFNKAKVKSVVENMNPRSVEKITEPSNKREMYDVLSYLAFAVYAAINQSDEQLKDLLETTIAVSGQYIDKNLKSPSKDLWIYVESDSIRKFKYNKKTKSLTVVFNSNDKEYKYYNVPDDIYLAFLSDKSKGKFFIRNIKNKYAEVR